MHGVGVDENKFKQDMTEEEKLKLREELGIEKDEFVIIYPAELSKRKNQGMLIKAISLLPNKNKIKVLLAGKDSYQGRYQKLAKELELEKQIMFLGFRKDIYKLMQISNLAVSTSLQEGLPVNIMEAMFMGLPIIATDCRGNRDLVKRNIKINNINELNKFIQKCLVDSNNFIFKDTKKYELKNILRKMEKIYNE